MQNRIHEPFPSSLEIPDELDFVSLKYDKDGYKVKVAEFAKDGGRIFEINFGKIPLAQRSMDEGKFLAMTAIANPDTGKIGPIVLVTGSDFLSWFFEQSCGIYSRDEVLHVAILTQSEWVEVLCLSLPEIYLIS